MTINQRARSIAAGLIIGGVVFAGCGSAAPLAGSTGTPAASVATLTPTSPPPSANPTAPVGQSPAASAAAGGDLPTTGRIEVTAKGYAITLPAAWTRIDLGADGLKDLMDAGASGLPQDMQDLLSGQVGQMAMSGVSLFAFRKPDGDVPAGTTLNILSLPSLGVPLDTFESLIVTQLKSVVGQDTAITTARVSGPAGEFLRLTYDLKAGGVTVGTVQYMFAGPTQQYVISCGTPGPVSAVQAECESIAKTLEVLN